MTLSVHHIALNASEPERIVSLYADGARFAQVAGEGGARWIAAPNAFVAIYPAREPPGEAARTRRVCDPGITHFCIQSGNGEALWDRLDAAGLAFNSAPVALGTGAIYAYGRDSECNVIEAEGVGDAPGGAAPWIAHVALATADLDRLGDFYARLIGRGPHRQGTFANALFEDITGLKDVRVSAKWIMADNMIVELWRYLNPPTVAAPPPRDSEPGYRHIGFSAVDLNAERERIRGAGIDLATGPTVGGLETLQGRDPDGNRFTIMQAAAPGHRLALASLSDPDRVTDRNRELLTR